MGQCFTQTVKVRVGVSDTLSMNTDRYPQFMLTTVSRIILLYWLRVILGLFNGPSSSGLYRRLESSSMAHGYGYHELHRPRNTQYSATSYNQQNHSTCCNS